MNQRIPAPPAPRVPVPAAIVQPKTAARPAVPRVPAPLVGPTARVQPTMAKRPAVVARGPAPVQRKTATGATTPRVPPPCGGNVVSIQPKTAAAARPGMPPVPPPCGGNVAPLAQPMAASRSAQPKMAPGSVIQRGQGPGQGNSKGEGNKKEKKITSGFHTIDELELPEGFNFEDYSKQFDKEKLEKEKQKLELEQKRLEKERQEREKLVRLYPETDEGEHNGFNQSVGKLLQSQQEKNLVRQQPLSMEEAFRWAKIALDGVDGGYGDYGKECRKRLPGVVMYANDMGYRIQDADVREFLRWIANTLPYSTQIGNTKSDWGGFFDYDKAQKK